MTPPPLSHGSVLDLADFKRYVLVGLADLTSNAF